jgi:hypothetical protein
MRQGYIKLWRKSLDAGWLKNHKLWVFWSYCLMKATYKECDVIIGLQTISLNPGQFIFGRKKAALETKLSEQEIRSIMDFLKKAGNLTIKTTNKFSIISIVNWDTYQGDEIENNQQSNKPLTNKQPTTNHIQEYKEVKKISNYDVISTEAFQKSWEEILPELPSLRVWTAKRKTALKARCIQIQKNTSELNAQNLDMESWWPEFFRYISSIPFLMGKAKSSNGHQNWCADIDFVLSESGFIKIAEGKYDNN